MLQKKSCVNKVDLIKHKHKRQDIKKQPPDVIKLNGCLMLPFSINRRRQ